METSNLNHIIKNQLEYEDKFLSKYAAKSTQTLGRYNGEEKCTIRTCYQRDRDRILHSKAFRRLKHKTQVFISPMGDHFRTRMTHALEVSQISRTIARALQLNEDLTEAIALGHDLGHTPFGHTGEVVLNELMQEGFRHNEQSVRVVTLIESLNLTQETIDGLANHTGDKEPMTLEGQVVKIADRIAYLNHDIDDAARAGIINIENIPAQCKYFFGNTHGIRITTMVNDLIQNSINKPEISMSKQCNEALMELRNWMFEKVYIDSPAKKEENKAKKVITDLFNYYFDKLSNHKNLILNDPIIIERTVADYVAGMTDRYAVKLYHDLFIPAPVNIYADDSFLYNLAVKNNVLCK